MTVGSKVGLVFDPFKLSTINTPTGVNPGEIVAATSPIPMTYLEDVELDSADRKLYAGFRGAGNVAVYDVNKLVARAFDDSLSNSPLALSKISWHQLGLDHPYADYASGVPQAEPPDPNKPPSPYSNTGRPVQEHENRINLQGIDIPTHTRGLSLQTPAGAGADRAVGAGGHRRWRRRAAEVRVGGRLRTAGRQRRRHVDYPAVCQRMAPGAGLWPDDPYRERPEDDDFLSDLFEAPNLGDDEDPNPGRFITAPKDLKIGIRYVVTATAEGGLRNEVNWEEKGSSGNDKRTIVEIDANARKALTAGQTYHWGVELLKAGKESNIYAAGSFDSAPVTADHSLQHRDRADARFPAGPAGLVLRQRPVPAAAGLPGHGQPDRRGGGRRRGAALRQAVRRLGRRRQATGAQACWLRRRARRWCWCPTGMSNPTSATPASPKPRPMRCMSRSSISTGSWAAPSRPAAGAQATYTKGDLLNSPLHFIGHSRGTDGQQRDHPAPGFPQSGRVRHPHDHAGPARLRPEVARHSARRLLKSVKETAGKLQTGAIVAGIASLVTGNLAAIPILAKTHLWLGRIENAIQKGLDTAEALGLALNIPYGDFKDPDVKIWSNVDFADNYYQTAASAQRRHRHAQRSPARPEPDARRRARRRGRTCSCRPIPRPTSTCCSATTTRTRASPASVSRTWKFSASAPASAGRTAVCGSGMPARSTPACSNSRTCRSGAARVKKAWPPRPSASFRC